MNTEIGKQRVVGWVLGKYCAKDLRYVLLDGHDAEVIRHDNLVTELNNQLEAQAVYSSMQFDRIAELTAEVARAMEFIEGIGSDLLNRRVADWYPEGAHNAASSMSEDMRLIGNACMEFAIARNALREGE